MKSRSIPTIRRKGSEVQVYSNTAWREEQQIARMLADLESEPVRHGARDPEEVLAELEKEENLELDQLQREAVLMAADHAILIVSGGPGTGKTTTINTIIRYFRKENAFWESGQSGKKGMTPSRRIPASRDGGQAGAIPILKKESTTRSKRTPSSSTRCRWWTCTCSAHSSKRSRQAPG